MSGEEESVIQRITTDVEKLLPLGGWVKTLVVGGVCIGAWVTTIQVQARSAMDATVKVEQKVDAFMATQSQKIDSFILAQGETNQRLARIEGRLEGGK
jgi:hypothetical protein